MNSRIPHGSPAGFEAGCRTRSACPNGDLSPWVSCAEASVRRRSDYRLWKLPLEQPIPRVGVIDHPRQAPGAPAADSPGENAHGTLGGYRRGCHRDRLCPHWTIGLTTCAGARRQYIREYRERRFQRDGHTITHGTPYGYYLGCRDRRTCPGGADAVTCSDAQAARKREIAAAAGIPPRVEPVDSLPASERIWALRAQGYSLREIARLTGCGHTTIAELARTGSGRRSHITSETLQRILGSRVER